MTGTVQGHIDAAAEKMNQPQTPLAGIGKKQQH